jgi:hypothetical protein
LGSAARRHAAAGLDEESVLIAMSFARELIQFLLIRKKYWLMPVVLLMALFGGLIVLSKGSAVAPFIYTLF